MRCRWLFSCVALAVIAVARPAHAGDWNQFMRCLGFGHSEGYHATGKWCCGPTCRIGNCGHGIPIDSSCGPQVPYATTTVVGSAPVHGEDKSLYSITRSPTVVVPSRSALTPPPMNRPFRKGMANVAPTVAPVEIPELAEPSIVLPKQ